MAASNEWEIQYLTENGWVSGGHKLDCGSTREEIKPSGAVLRIRRHVTVGKLGAPSSMKVDETKSELIRDTEKIQSLLAKFGNPPFGV